MIEMLKLQLTFISILLGCVFILSCEYAQDIMKTDPPKMMDPDKMMEMMDGSPIVINELMADNDNTIEDPQGDYDDWLELHNLTDTVVVLSGMYLSDKVDNPTKWQFPDGTEILANGYLIVWLDEDHDGEEAAEGLHANFKLSKNGEMVMLVDTDINGNEVLDSITFGEQETDTTFGRIPNGTGGFQIVVASPDAENVIE